MGVQAVTDKIFQEAYRITKPGGVIAILETYPLSKAFRNLPPILYVLRGITVNPITH